MKKPRYIRSAVLRGFDTAATSVNLDPVVLLKKVGLTSEWSASTNRLLSLDAYLELLAISASLSRCHDFGIRAALANGVPNLGAVSLLMREATNVEAAISTMSAYISLHSDAITISLDANSYDPFISFEVLARTPEQAFQGNQYWLAGLVLSLRWLAGQDFKPNQVCFTHSKKLSSQIATQFFGCSITSNETASGILISKEFLARPLATSASFLREEALQHLMRTIRVPTTSFAATVAIIIRRRLAEGDCTADNISAELGIDRRTLNRWLQPERQTFSSMLQQVRNEVVREHLNNEDYCLNELTEAAGFISQSAFCRWFQATFDCTTSEMRRRIKEPR